ncbi:MAG: nodulation protein NodZ [Desulfovibrionaceae bacterium]
MQKILVLRASGGLSNRLQVVLAGIAHCLLSGRALYVDWRDGMYSDDFSNVFPRWFHVRGLPTVEVIPAPQKKELYPPFWQGWLQEAVAVEYLFNNDHLNAENRARTSIDFTRIDYPETVIVGWGADLQPALALAPLLREQAAALQQPFLAGYSDPQIIRWLAQEYLHLQARLAQRVEDFAARHFPHPHTVGIHIRHTDLQSPLENMLACLRQITDTAEKACNIFLATDNKHVQSTVGKMFPQAVFCPKHFPAGDEPLHCFVPDVANVPKGEEALIDMYLLSKCDELIYYHKSSFSRIPLLLADLPAARVHAL